MLSRFLLSNFLFHHPSLNLELFFIPNVMKILALVMKSVKALYNKKQHDKPITPSWIESLQPPRSVRAESRLTIREIWTLDNVRKVASVSTETLREERAKAGICMLFLSAMRADALASMPIGCVDLPNRTLYQLPEKGVHTKNSKAAKTYLLDIPDLLDVVHAWQARLIAARFTPDCLWYSNLARDAMTLVPTKRAIFKRYSMIEDDLQMICQKADVPYLSPHKVRHGHIVYALKRAQNVAQLKAVSQNSMHASIVTTDQIYGKLVNDDVQDIISSL